MRRKKGYREKNKRCLKCNTKISPEISRRRFCLMCNIKHTQIIRTLKRLNFKNFIFV